MQSYRFEGVVLKRMNYGEADKIITFFTREKGKLSLLVKGVRRATSRRAGSVELFQQIRGYAISGKGGLDILTEVQLLKSSTSWQKFLGRITIAYELSEVVDKLTPDQIPQPDVYDYLISCLSNIPQLDGDWQQVTKKWLLHIITLLGFWPDQQIFTGDIHKYLESIMDQSFNSPKLRKKLASSVK